MRAFAVLLAILLLAGEAFAHQTRLSYINVDDRSGSSIAIVKIAFLDLQTAVGLDRDFDGKITWGEAKASLDRISAYVRSRTDLTAGGRCGLSRASAATETLNGEGYLTLQFGVECPDPAAPVSVASSLLLDVDPTGRVLVSSQTGGAAQTYVLDSRRKPADETARMPGAGRHQEASFLSYFQEGVSHLFGGMDHLLFLLVLVAPAIHAGDRAKAVVLAILLPITGFTLGHALTLTSAMSGLIRPQAQIVEVLIAVTILLTAIDNVRRFLPGPRSLAAFAFGLIHGFGFAGALGGLDVAGWSMAIALLGFNLGIEAGQAALALAVTPMLFLARKLDGRSKLIANGVSALGGALAVYWIIERTLSV